MMHKFVLNHRQKLPQLKGMLFVRTVCVIQTMVKTSLIIAGLLIVAVMMPLQYSFALTKTLDLIVYPDGSTHVFSEIQVDPLAANSQIDLHGDIIDNFVVRGQDGTFLISNILDNKAIVETFGIPTILVNYDVHDLISKQGRTWTFLINTTADFTLLMPENSIIVSMNSFPISLNTDNGQSKLTLPLGDTRVEYIIGIPVSDAPQDQHIDLYVFVIGLGVSTVVVAFIINGKKNKAKLHVKSTKTDKPLDAKTIFEQRSDLREDDKEIVLFLHENGGKALESELRKKFLLPRTTMWRAVKRLERNGVIKIEKKDLQNLVKLCEKLEDEQ